MGIYLNPGNRSFIQAKNSMIYVDKTRLLEFLNKRLYTEDKCIALSHARRFGKSHAAGMIDAYYSRGCDSTELFEDTKLADNADYTKHMNKYNVIHLDISSFWDDFKDNIVEKIQEYVLDEIKEDIRIPITKQIKTNNYNYETQAIATIAIRVYYTGCGMGAKKHSFFFYNQRRTFGFFDAGR